MKYRINLATKVSFILLVFFLFVPVSNVAASAQLNQACTENPSTCTILLECNSFSHTCCDPNIAGSCATSIGGSRILGNSCSNIESCKAGFICDGVSNTCLLPTGSDCTATRFCVNGDSCVGGRCIADSQKNADLCLNVICNPGVPCNPVNGQCINPIVGTNNTGVAGVGTGDCGDTGLVYENGVCLPADQECTDGSFRCTSSLTGLLVGIIKFLLGLAGAIAVLVLVVGGFWYITSGGNEETAEKGKKAIINAIIGIVVIVLSYAVVTVISNTLSKTP